MATAYLQDPAAVLDWRFDWTGWLAEGETITTHTVTVTGATLDSSAVVSGVVVAWLSGAGGVGGTGTSAEAVCHIVTSEGREDDRTLRIAVVNR